MRHVCERAASTHCMRALRSNNAGGSSAECVRDGKRIATVWCLSVCLSRFYPRDAILARVLAVALWPCLSVCLSVCHKSVFCQKGWADEYASWHEGFFRPCATLCFKETQASTKITILSLGTFSRSLDLENFAAACRSSNVLST